MSTVHNRFQVGDRICGQVENCQNKAVAITTARAHREHHREDGNLSVFVVDRMAHKGCPDIRFEARSDGSDIYCSKEWREGETAMAAMVWRRSFEASQFPTGHPDRARLNLDARTSEYYPSKRYLVIESNGWTHLARTKKEAMQISGNRA